MRKQKQSTCGIQNTALPTPLTASSKVLSIDPSFSYLGWGVFSNSTLIDSGCLQKKKLTLFEFAKEFNKIVDEVLSKHDIALIVTEIPVGSKSYSAAKALAFCNGMVFASLSRYNIPVAAIEPKKAKHDISGAYKLDKDGVLAAVEQNMPSIFNEIKNKHKYLKETLADCAILYRSAFEENNGHQV